MASAKINALLQKGTHYDADERSMATWDLNKELEGIQGVLEASLQVPVRDYILRQLDDKSNNVATMAVKCLSQCVQKFSSDNIVSIADKLGQMVVDPQKSASVDIMADGCKTVVASVLPEHGKTVAPKLVTSLISGLSPRETPAKDADDVSLELTCLDLLQHVLRRFGNDIEPDQLQKLQQCISRLLQHKNQDLCLRASETLGPLVTVLDEKQFKTLMDFLLVQLEKSTKPEIFIQSIGVISKAAGVRLGQFLPNIIPKLEYFCKDDSKGSEEQRLQLWETCLQAFADLIHRCPTKVSVYIERITTLGLKFLKHDPQYMYDDAEAMQDEKGASGGGDDGWGDDGGWGDDSATKEKDSWGAEQEVVQETSADTSWKVRRAAVAVLDAIIRSPSGDLLKPRYSVVCDALVSRFKEHDQSVREVILLACRDLLHQAVQTSPNSSSASAMEDDDKQFEAPTLTRTRSTYETVVGQVENIVNGIDKYFKGGNVQSKKAMLSLLCELVLVRKGGLQEHFSKLIPIIISSVEATGAAASLNSEALKFLHGVVELHDFQQLESYVPNLAKTAITAVKSGGENKPESLRACGSLAALLKGKASKMGSVAQDLFSVTLSQLAVTDVPEKVKFAAISTMATVLASFGTAIMQKQAAEVCNLLSERLSNEATRLNTLKALERIARSDVPTDLTLVLRTSLKEIASFMRKTSSPLKHATVECLEALIRTHSKALTDKDIEMILSEVGPHISESDIQLSRLVLDMVSTTLEVNAGASVIVADKLLSNAINFVKSPLIQGPPQQALIRFFQYCILSRSKAQSLSYVSLLKSLLSCVPDVSTNKIGRTSIAQCIAGCAAKAADKEVSTTVSDFLMNVREKATGNIVLEVSLLSVGEIGRTRDLAGHAELEQVIFNAFESKDDHVRQAASFALGNASAGNMTKYIPIIVGWTKSKPAQIYPLLSSLKETISTHSSDRRSMQAFLPYLDVVVPILAENAESKDEGTRFMVAECVGRLLVIETRKMMPMLKEMSKAKNPRVREGAVTALRFCLSPLMSYDVLQNEMDNFVPLLKDVDLEVRRQAFLTINGMFRVNADVIDRDLCKKILPLIYAETKPNKDLIHEVDFGAFKQIVDDGLPLRKSAFQCLGTMLQTVHHRLDMQEYVSFVQQGLTDQEDIQITTYQTFRDIATFHGSAILEILDGLSKTIMSGVKNHLKNAKLTGQEAERAKDCLMACVRALDTFNKIPGVDICKEYKLFFKQVCATPLLVQMIKELESPAK